MSSPSPSRSWFLCNQWASLGSCLLCPCAPTSAMRALIQGRAGHLRLSEAEVTAHPSRSSEREMLPQPHHDCFLATSHSRAAVLGGPSVRVGSLPWSWPVRAQGAQGNSHEKRILSIQLCCTCSLLAARSWAGGLPGPQIPHQAPAPMAEDTCEHYMSTFAHSVSLCNPALCWVVIGVRDGK